MLHLLQMLPLGIKDNERGQSVPPLHADGIREKYLRAEVVSLASSNSFSQASAAAWQTRALMAARVRRAAVVAQPHTLAACVCRTAVDARINCVTEQVKDLTCYFFLIIGSFHMKTLPLLRKKGTLAGALKIKVEKNAKR